MSHQFDRLSLSIELDADYFSFDIGYLYGSASFSHEYPILRVYMHEVLHFWQALSVGFISNLALGEWGALLEYERTNNPSSQIKLLKSFTLIDNNLGFSAANLSEALCRYWEIHILNPAELLEEEQGSIINQPEVDESLTARGKQLLQEFPENSPFHHYPPHIVARIVDGSAQEYSSQDFDNLINKLMQSRDDYAVPYQLMLRQLGTNNSVILFPLVGYFALQTKAPIKVFADVVMQLAQTLQLVNQSRMNIHEAWRNVYATVYRACQGSSLRLTGSLLTPGWDVITHHLFTTNPVYSHYLQLLKYLRAERWYMGEKHQSDLNPLFALPGDPTYRTILASTFRPPATFFYNNEHWTRESISHFAGFGGIFDAHDQLDAMTEEQAQGWDVSPKLVLSRDDLANAAITIHHRVREMRHAAVKARYSQVARG